MLCILVILFTKVHLHTHQLVYSMLYSTSSLLIHQSRTNLTSSRSFSTPYTVHQISPGQLSRGEKFWAALQTYGNLLKALVPEIYSEAPQVILMHYWPTYSRFKPGSLRWFLVFFLFLLSIDNLQELKSRMFSLTIFFIIINNIWAYMLGAVLTKYIRHCWSYYPKGNTATQD